MLVIVMYAIPIGSYVYCNCSKSHPAQSISAIVGIACALTLILLALLLDWHDPNDPQKEEPSKLLPLPIIAVSIWYAITWGPLCCERWIIRPCGCCAEFSLLEFFVEKVWPHSGKFLMTIATVVYVGAGNFATGRHAGTIAVEIVGILAAVVDVCFDCYKKCGEDSG